MDKKDPDSSKVETSADGLQEVWYSQGQREADSIIEYELGVELLRRHKNEYYWRGEKLPGKPEITNDEDGGRTVAVPYPGKPNEFLYKLQEDSEGRVRSKSVWNSGTNPYPPPHPLHSRRTAGGPSVSSTWRPLRK
jgi:hypothetical protein